MQIKNQNNNDYIEGLEDGDDEIIEDLKTKTKESEVTVISRAWTVETICSQIKQENINLNPKFQRRNVWSDKRRSQLIESFILAYPIPEIVLAEERRKKRSFLVIDGKQRLLTLAGFFYPNDFAYWDSPILRELKILKRKTNHFSMPLKV